MSCDVIRDLLPLYTDQAASADTVALVEEHLASCPACQGNFQLNVFLPVSAYNFLLSARLLGDVCDSFRVHCVEGITPNVERMTANLHNSLMLVTCLTPRIGYEAAAACAKKALHDGTTLKEAVLALGYLTGPEFDETVRPEKMV